MSEVNKAPLELHDTYVCGHDRNPDLGLKSFGLWQAQIRNRPKHSSRQV
jgi:hypothetical protein